jgi:hypothetical protein
VGDHRLELSAPGYASEQRSLRVNGGEARTLELDLRAQSQITPGAAPLRATSSGSGPRPVADHDDDGSPLSSPWFWIAVGVVAAGTAVGVAVATREEMTLTADPYGGDSDVVLRGP